MLIAKANNNPDGKIMLKIYRVVIGGEITATTEELVETYELDELVTATFNHKDLVRDR